MDVKNRKKRVLQEESTSYLIPKSISNFQNTFREEKEIDESIKRSDLVRNKKKMSINPESLSKHSSYRKLILFNQAPNYGKIHVENPKSDETGSIANQEEMKTFKKDFFKSSFNPQKDSLKNAQKKVKRERFYSEDQAISKEQIPYRESVFKKSKFQLNLNQIVPIEMNFKKHLLPMENSLNKVIKKDNFLQDKKKFTDDVSPKNLIFNRIRNEHKNDQRETNEKVDLEKNEKWDFIKAKININVQMKKDMRMNSPLKIATAKKLLGRAGEMSMKRSSVESVMESIDSNK